MLKFQLNRRGFFGFAGGAAVSAPKIPNIIDEVTKQKMIPDKYPPVFSCEVDNSDPECGCEIDYEKESYLNYILKNGLPEYQKHRINHNSKIAHEIERKYIDGLKSVSPVMKNIMKRDVYVKYEYENIMHNFKNDLLQKTFAKITKLHPWD